MNSFPFLSSLCLLLLALPNNTLADEKPVEYGVDISFPMHHFNISTNYPWLPHNVDPSIPTPPEYIGMPIQPLGDRKKFYEDLLKSCEDHFGPEADCLGGEIERLEMSIRQASSMKNFTDMGFRKIKAPEKVFKLIHEFWQANRDKATVEEWGLADMVTNNWQVNSTIADVGESSLAGGGEYLQKEIWAAAQETIQEWTGQKLAPSSVYGVRVYHTGAILAPHVDRIPLVSSAIIQVDQDVDEPWPLEVIDHDGKAHNVTMEPGDMVLYESHSVLHGRPFPLKGRFVANIFIHFEPAGANGAMSTMSVADEIDVTELETLPDYILPDSLEAQRWHKMNPARIAKRAAAAQDVTAAAEDVTPGFTPLHLAAQSNDLRALKEAVEKNQGDIHARDANGWTPLHEGARMGHLDVVRFLLESGADVNAETADGGTVLWWARNELGNDHPILELLETHGAEDIETEL